VTPPYPPTRPPPCAGLEAPSFHDTKDGLANDMGLFLQKTNIIRDYLVCLCVCATAVVVCGCGYSSIETSSPSKCRAAAGNPPLACLPTLPLHAPQNSIKSPTHTLTIHPSPNPHRLPSQEDINEEPRPRMWWPRDIWGRYADSLEAFKQPEHAAAAVRCLNHMVRWRWRAGRRRERSQGWAPCCVGRQPWGQRGQRPSAKGAASWGLAQQAALPPCLRRFQPNRLRPYPCFLIFLDNPIGLPHQHANKRHHE
jgi:hypothetical protein